MCNNIFHNDEMLPNSSYQMDCIQNLHIGVDVSYNGSLFVLLWIFCKVYSIQMPQTHCKIINLENNIYGLKLPTWIRIFIKGEIQ
jgi:hypothetical protein